MPKPKRVYKPLWKMGWVGWTALGIGIASTMSFLLFDDVYERLVAKLYDLYGFDGTWTPAAVATRTGRIALLHSVQGLLIFACIAVGWRLTGIRIGEGRWVAVFALCVLWPTFAAFVLTNPMRWLGNYSAPSVLSPSMLELVLLISLASTGTVVLIRTWTTPAAILWVLSLIMALWPLGTWAAGVGNSWHLYYWTGWYQMRGNGSYWTNLQSVAPTMCIAAAMLHIGCACRARGSVLVCPICEYSRQGLAETAPCPECGERPITAEPAEDAATPVP